MFKLTGQVKVKNEAVQVSDKFRKLEFVVTTQETYPQDVQFQLTQDKCDIPFNVGDSVEVNFNIRGREYNGRYFVNLEAWKVDVTESAQPSVPPIGDTVKEPESDLPF